MSHDRISRNAPCPCGSGKKYKHCCGARSRLEGRQQDQPTFPIGTVAQYGPDDKTTTKIAAAVIRQEGAEPILMRWVGTDVTFDLSQVDGQTLIVFGHRNWREAVEFTAHCSMKWATFLLSLRELVETGRGRPSPDDLKIDNWN